MLELPQPAHWSPLRVVIAKPGLDGHDRGAKVIARALRDAGHQVVYTGLHRTPRQVVATVISENASLLGLSILSGAHLTIVDEVVRLLDEHYLDHVRLLVGGIIPVRDTRELLASGVDALYTSGTPVTEVVEAVNQYAAEG